MSLKKCRLKKGDNVVVTTGKDKGKTGKILEILKQEERVLVEGINLVKKHKKSESQENKKPQILEKEAPIHISNVMYYSQQSKKGHRIQYQLLDNRKVRVLSNSNEKVD